jgi:homoserine kinase
VNRWLSATVEVRESETARLSVEHSGTLSVVLTPIEQDLLVVGFNAARRRAGHDRPITVSIAADSEIPVARGLGSSAAALVAGAALAIESLQLPLSREDVLEIGAEVEGHPDNVAAAVYGGAVLGVPTRGHRFRTAQLAVSPSIAFVFVSPEFVTETKRARAVLPAEVPYAQAVVAAGKSAALVRGLETGEPGLLTIGLDDVLHVPYRRSLIRGFDEVTGAAIAAGAFGATLSGSGSTLVAIVPKARARAVGASMQKAWEKLDVVSSVLLDDGTAAGYAAAGGAGDSEALSSGASQAAATA